MQVKLSPRLGAIAELIPEGSVVADIGTDHGYLPVHLMTQNISSRVIAADIHEKPLSSARELVEMLNLTKKIDIRLGDGMQVLKPGESDVIVVAGMGGKTICSILAAAPDILQEVKKIIVQPMIGSRRVREWFMNNNFIITDEKLVEDTGIIYEIIVAEHGNASYSSQELIIGPQLLVKKPLLLKKYLEQQKLHYTNIISQTSKSSSEEALIKKNYYIERLQIVDKVIACL